MLRGGRPPGGTLDSRAGPRGQPAPTRPCAPCPGGCSPRTFCSRSMRPGARHAAAHSQRPVRGERTGGQARPGSRSKGVPPRCRILIPRRLSRMLTARQVWKDREGGARRAVRLGSPRRWPQLSVRSAPTRRACGRAGRADALHLFLSHCSSAPKEMTAGVSRLPSAGWPLHPLRAHTCRALPPPESRLQAARPTPRRSPFPILPGML